MRYLTAEEIIRIHDSETEAPLRERHLLESAVGAPAQTWGGTPLWPSIHLQAAALMRSLAQNQPFADGNKRTALIAAHAFYGMNGYILRHNDTDMLHLLIGIAVEHLEVPKIAEFLEMGAWEIPEEERSDDGLAED